MPADGVADSMYAGTVFVGGRTGELGADAVDDDFIAADRDLVFGLLERAGRSPRRAASAS